MAFQKILCPVDVSLGSQRALAAAAQLSRRYDCELALLHAWSLPAHAQAGGYVYPADLVQGFANDAQRGLDAAMAHAGKLAVRHTTARLVAGPAGQTILNTLKADPSIDLVVIGSHGRTGSRHVQLGPVAETVVRYASRPVLTVRPDREPRPFRHIFCPVDFSPEARAAADLAGELAQAGGQGIVLFHALELPGALGELRPVDVERRLHRVASARLAEWADQLAGGAEVPVAARVCVGRPSVELLAVLDADHDFDLVVIGHRGCAGTGRMVIGSVAEKVVRHAHCPVLITPARRGGS